MNRIVTFAIVLLAGLSSCKKDRVESQKPVTDGTLMSFVMRGEEPIQELTYTSNGQIYELVESYSYRKYIYNAQHQLEKIEQAFSVSPFSCAMPGGGAIREGDDPRKAKVTQYFVFEYNAGQLAKKNSYYIVDNNPTMYSYQTYTYDSENFIKISVYNPDGLLMNYQTYTIGADGNVSHDEFYVVENGTDVRLLSANQYEYDTKNNPYQVFASEGTPGIYTNKNNIVKKTMIYYSQSGETRNIVETPYEYNTFDYPSKNGELSFLYFQPATE